MKAMRSALEGRIGGVESSLGKVESSLGRRIGSVESFITKRFAKLEDAVQVFDTWKPTIDASVKELRLEMGAIHKSEEAVEKMREEMTALRKTVSHAALNAGPSAPASNFVTGDLNLRFSLRSRVRIRSLLLPSTLVRFRSRYRVHSRAHTVRCLGPF
jgi:hypothetical protein